MPKDEKREAVLKVIAELDAEDERLRVAQAAIGEHRSRIWGTIADLREAFGIKKKEKPATAKGE